MNIGIFGGAFNPPHIEHIRIIEELIGERHYDKVLIMPSVNPPHKRSVVTPFVHRMNMVKIAFSHIPCVEFIDLENRDNGVHYSYDIIGKLKNMYPNDRLEFIIGGDSMIDFHTWYRPDDIARMIDIVVVARGRDDIAKVKSEMDRYNANGAHISLSKYIASEVSSSCIRCALYLHDDIVPNVDKDVLSYIISNGLYNDYDAMLERLRDNLNPHRYEHTKGVCRYAMKLNESLRLDFDSVMTATLLHDSAKGRIHYDYDIPRDTIGTNVEHAFMGREVAHYVYGVEDESVLSAIRYHCTARPNMTTLDKLVYSADMLEMGRDYEGVEELRAIIEDDFEAGFRACLKATYEHIVEAGYDMYPLTKEAYNYYNL